MTAARWSCYSCDIADGRGYRAFKKHCHTWRHYRNASGRRRKESAVMKLPLIIRLSLWSPTIRHLHDRWLSWNSPKRKRERMK